ncbi:MAG: FAD binding domain-containing protein [Burkholderiales bacterium]
MKGGRALVIGGSLGGLFAAHTLQRIGWDVCIFERSADDLATRGAGIGTHSELFDVMREIGVPVDPDLGIALHERVCLDRDGLVSHRIPMPQTMSAWARIYRPLKDAFPAERSRFNTKLTRVELHGNRVHACFADGSREEGDLLVGADGIRSTVREQFTPEVQPRYAGYVAWRGLVDEGDFSPASHAALFHRYTFCLPDGEVLLAYPVPGVGDDTRAGHRAMNFVWYRPVDPVHILPDLCTDATGHQHGLAIPPPLIRADVLAAIRASADRLLAPQIAETIHRTKQLFFQPIFDLESPQLVFGRAVLLGDAAFVARPHVGAGITKAALDAKTLAAALVESPTIEAALTRYDIERRRFGSGLVARGRRLGAYLEAQLKPIEQRTAIELHQDPLTVMREMGAPLAGVRELSAAASAYAQSSDLR